MNIVACVSLAALCLVGVSEGLQCFNCQNITDPNQCREVTQCSSGQSCSLLAIHADSNLRYNMGCQGNQQCTSSAVAATGIIGRSIQTRQQHSCHECCGTDRCNDHLCAYRKPSECTDDETIDCARMNTIFNVCADVHHAKITCPKFCGLCQLVDGSWTDWGTWTPCSVTCENGKQSRTRTCTNPSPSNGGLNCYGPDVESQLCTKQLCPVHGNWSDWSTWSGCSVTCDVGLTKKTRTCTNPRPDRFGDNCYGDASEYTVCQTNPCNNPVHGSWSDWAPWSVCSVTCDVGLRKRSRTCTNPRPDRFGDYCLGDASEYTVCQNDPSINPVHGNWSDWSAWSSCSVTCDVGLRERSRTCNNPKPDRSGEYCVGNTNDNTVCLTEPCANRNGDWSSWGSWQSCSVTCGVGLKLRDRTCTSPSPTLYGKACEGNSEAFAVCANTACHAVVFSAHGLNVLPMIQVNAFPTVIFNEGNAYNNNTGHFTAPVNGIYYFAAQICSTADNSIYFTIHKGNENMNAVEYLTVTLQHSSNSASCTSASSSVKLKRNEHVFVGVSSQSVHLYEAGNGWNTFTGTLIQEL